MYQLVRYSEIPPYDARHYAHILSTTVLSDREKCLRAFLSTVVMKTMEYTCAQSFISLCTIVGKFEK